MPSYVLNVPKSIHFSRPVYGQMKKNQIDKVVSKGTFPNRWYSGLRNDRNLRLNRCTIGNFLVSTILSSIIIYDRQHWKDWPQKGEITEAKIQFTSRGVTMKPTYVLDCFFWLFCLEKLPLISYLLSFH